MKNNKLNNRTEDGDDEDEDSSTSSTGILGFSAPYIGAFGVLSALFIWGATSTGTDGRDTITSDAGSDKLVISGSGTDTITSDAGNDKLVISGSGTNAKTTSNAGNSSRRRRRRPAGAAADTISFTT